MFYNIILYIFIIWFIVLINTNLIEEAVLEQQEA